jgi:hypothetical protein
VRQRRVARWDSPPSLNATRKVAFGVGSGSDAPYGTASPTYFVGLKTFSAWVRHDQGNYWNVGWTVVTASPGSESTHDNNFNTLRVSTDEEELCTSWYFRAVRVGAFAARLEIFTPQGPDAPTEDEFVTQMARSKWTRSVGNHSSYVQSDFTLGLNEASLGYLDAFNFYSNLQNFVSGRLRAATLVTVRAVQLE